MDSNSPRFQIISIILLFVLFLISEYISNKLFQFSLINNLTGLLILVIILLIYLTAIGYFTRRRLQREISKDFEDFKKSTGIELKNLSIAVEKISVDWLLTQSDINTIEKGITKEMEIWIITPDLKNDTNIDDPQIMEIIEIVKRNMAKGIKYTYIVPDRDAFVRGKIDELINIFEEFKGADKLNVKRIDKDYFSLLGNMCFVIYNPRSVLGRPSKVYLELPRVEKKWWIEISRTQATTFEGRIAEIIDQLK